MIYEYQVLYKDSRGNAGSFNLCAENDAQAILKGQKLGLNVVDVTELKPVVDWTKPVLSVEEAGIYCGYARTQWYGVVSLGKVNFVKDGEGQKRFRRVDLEQYLRRNLHIDNKPAPLQAAA